MPYALYRPQPPARRARSSPWMPTVPFYTEPMLGKESALNGGAPESPTLSTFIRLKDACRSLKL